MPLSHSLSEFYHGAVLINLLFALLTFPILLFVAAPYGRYNNWGGLQLNETVGWIIMEVSSPFFFLLAFLTHRTGPSYGDLGAALFLLHYTYRTFIYPMRLRGSTKTKPLLTTVMGFCFNFINGTTNGLAAATPSLHIAQPLVIAFPAVVLFSCGFVCHVLADNSLRSLRRPGDTGYYIPRGFPFDTFNVSCPNFAGEMLQWGAFAVAFPSAASCCFAISTVSNLLPRGLQHHAWYKRTFRNYPDRWAVVPGVV